MTYGLEEYLRIPTNAERRLARRRRVWPWVIAGAYVLVCWVAPVLADRYLITVAVCHGIIAGVAILAVGSLAMWETRA